jgi:hypothetical protein
MLHHTSQKWKGLFRSPFILQTVAAHITAIKGSVRVPDLHNAGKPTPGAIGGLGLAAASVRYNIVLWSCHSSDGC